MKPALPIDEMRNVPMAVQRMQQLVITKLTQSYLNMIEKSLKNFEQFVIDEKARQLEKLMAQ